MTEERFKRIVVMQRMQQQSLMKLKNNKDYKALIKEKKMSYEVFAQRCREGHGFTKVIKGYQSVVLHLTKRIFNADTEKQIETAWNEKVQSGAVKRNDQLVALFPEQTSVENSVLHLSRYATDFKHYITTREVAAPQIWLSGPSAVTRIIREVDSLYIIGERKSKNLNTGGALEFVPGGFLKAAHLYDADPLRSTLEEELDEETGIKPTYIASITPLWYGELEKFPDGRASRNVCLDYLMNIEDITQRQVQEQFASKEREHTQLMFVPEHELVSFGEANYARFNTRGLCTFEQLIAQGVLA